MKTSIFVAGLALTSITALNAQDTATAFLGWDLSEATLIDPVDAFNTGQTSNTNISINGTENIFTLNFEDGGILGSATFSVIDNDTVLPNPDILRQFKVGLSAGNSAAATTIVTLESAVNIASLTLDAVVTTSDSDNNYVGTLPDSTISSTLTNLNAAWNVGESYTFGHLGLTSDNINFNEFQVTASLTSIPEASTSALIAVATGLGLVYMKRRKHS